MSCSGKRRITLKNYKKSRSRNGEAFSASVYIDGTRVGTVSNSGTGGPNDYIFNTVRHREEFFKIVNAWNTETGSRFKFEAEDCFISEILLRMEYLVIRKNNAKAGMHITFIGRRGKSNLKGYPEWESEAVYGCSSEERMHALIKQYGIEEYEVLTADTEEKEEAGAVAKKK